MINKHLKLYVGIDTTQMLGFCDVAEKSKQEHQLIDVSVVCSSSVRTLCNCESCGKQNCKLPFQVKEVVDVK